MADELLDLELEDKDGNSLYVSTHQAEELIVDVNDEVVALSLADARRLLETVRAWVEFHSLGETLDASKWEQMTEVEDGE